MFSRKTAKSDPQMRYTDESMQSVVLGNAQCKDTLKYATFVELWLELF